MNQVEIWFGTLNRRLLRWGSFKSVKDLEDSIRRFVAQYNEIWAHPYKWTYNDVPERPEGTLVGAMRTSAEEDEAEGEKPDEAGAADGSGKDEPVETPEKAEPPEGSQKEDPGGFGAASSEEAA